MAIYNQPTRLKFSDKAFIGGMYIQPDCGVLLINQHALNQRPDVTVR